MRVKGIGSENHGRKNSGHNIEQPQRQALLAEHPDVGDSEAAEQDATPAGEQAAVAIPRMANVINLMAQAYYEAGGTNLSLSQKPYPQTPLSFQLEAERRMTCALESLANSLGYDVAYNPVEKSS